MYRQVRFESTILCGNADRSGPKVGDGRYFCRSEPVLISARRVLLRIFGIFLPLIPSAMLLSIPSSPVHPPDAAERQFNLLLDRTVTINKNDVSVKDAIGEILFQAIPGDDLPLVKRSAEFHDGIEMYEQRIALHFENVSVRDAFATLVADTHGAMDVSWDDRRHALSIHIIKPFRKNVNW